MTAPVILTRTEAETLLAEKKLHAYVQQAWPIVEPVADFVDNWHIHAICEHLEAVSRGEIRNLIINIPPRCMKSLLVAVFWPTWTWIQRPHIRWLFSTYTAALTYRDSAKCKLIIDSPWYQERWGGRFQIRKNQKAISRFENDSTGFRLATSTEGAATGEGGDVVVCDDPLKAKDAFSDAKRKSVNLWWDGTMSTRLNDRRTGARVIIMQRLHEDDLVGHILRKIEEEDGTHYDHLMLPMEFEPDRKCVFPQGITVKWQGQEYDADPRDNRGDLLWPERFNEADVRELKQDLGSYSAAAQLQQRPAPEGGGLFKGFWWRFWIPENANIEDFGRPNVTLPDGTLHRYEVVNLPPAKRRVDMQTWDAAFKGNKEASSFVDGLVVSIDYPNFYVIDEARGKMDFPQTLDAIRQMSQEHPRANAILIEDKANGPAIMQVLKSELPGVLPWNPEGDKVARGSALAPVIETGNVYLPHPKIAPWVWDFIEEFNNFPMGANDDRIDNLGQCVQWAKQRYGGKRKVRAKAVA